MFTTSLRILRAVLSVSCALWLHHALPLLQLQKKIMQRSRGFCHGVVASKICYNAVIVLSTVQCDYCKPTNSCRDWAFSNSGLEVGLPAFSCRCSQKVTHCRKEICSTCLFKESIPATPSGNFNHPLPATSRFLRAAAGSTTFALWLHHAHSFVAAAEKGRKSFFYAEKRRVWPRSYGLQDLLQCSDCALTCAMWLLRTNEQLSRLSF